MFMGTTVFEIAGGSGRPPPPWYKVWVQKGLVQEGLKENLNFLYMVSLKLTLI